MSMKSGTQTLGFRTRPPSSTGRYHPSYKVANAKAAIDATARQSAGSDKVKCLDFDTQVIYMYVDKARKVKEPVAVGLHWNRLGQDGWTAFINDKGKLQRFTRDQLKWSVQKFVDLHGGDVAAFHMLRRPNGEHPMTHYEAMVYARTEGVVLCPELKHPAFGDHKTGAAARLVKYCRILDYPCWCMALFSMSWCKEKCAEVIWSGGYFAPIFGDMVRWAFGASRIKGWPVRPTTIWGPSSARQWLSTWRPIARAGRAG